MTVNNKNTIFGVLVFIILGGIAAFLINKDLNKASLMEDDTNNGTATTTEGAVLNGSNNNPGYTIEVEPVGSTGGASVPTPDLDRRVNFETASQSLKQKIEEISADLKKDKNNFDLWLDLGSYRKIIGDYEGARLTWEYLAAVNPNYTVPLINLGDLYQFYLKDYSLADDYMQRVISKTPTSVDAYYRLYSLYALSYQEKINEAPKILLQGLSVNPKSVELMIMLAEHYRNLNDKTNAIIYYDKAIAELNAVGDNTRMLEVKNARDAI